MFVHHNKRRSGCTWPASVMPMIQSHLRVFRRYRIAAMSVESYPNPPSIRKRFKKREGLENISLGANKLRNHFCHLHPNHTSSNVTKQNKYLQDYCRLPVFVN